MTGDWRTWLLIGATGFGGPAGQVALLHRELVERRRWLDEAEFLAALRVCMLLPGPEAQQLATYAGWRRAGWAGGLVAGTLFVLPGAVLVTGLAWLHAAGGDWPLFAAAFAGTRPAVTALVTLAAWRIARRSLTSPAAFVILAAALVALAAGVAFPLVVCAAGLLGGIVTPPAGAAEVTAAPVPLDTGGLRSALGHVVAVAVTAALLWVGCLATVVVTRAAGAGAGDGAVRPAHWRRPPAAG